jgi:hypothetical protein
LPDAESIATSTSEGTVMSLALVAAVTGLCFAGAVAAITVGLTSR